MNKIWENKFSFGLIISMLQYDVTSDLIISTYTRITFSFTKDKSSKHCVTPKLLDMLPLQEVT